MRRKLRFFAEYLLVQLFVWLMRALPARTASNIGGWLGRTIGPHVKRTQLARSLMATHLPHSSATDRERYLTEMWDHLGRVICEYPHLAAGHMDSWYTLHGSAHFEAAKATGKPIMIISGHIGNWEMIGKVMALQGEKMHLVYRPPNNPYLDRLIDRIRARFTLGHYGKGAEAAKGTLMALKKGETIGMLIDQKDNAGAMVRFLEADAMTMLSGAKLAKRSGAILLPMKAIRVNGTHFRCDIMPPIAMPDPAEYNDDEAHEIAIMQRLNGILSDWIRETPGQWFWVHRRWPKA
jgi:KDO2-lipid IV(A) lauroyltransferase